MIVFHQRSIVEADPVIHTTPHADGVLLQSPKSGCRFPRIQNLAREILNGIDVFPR
jgi:hypothetical protein